jgi:Tol biopolymer transport system component
MIAFCANNIPSDDDPSSDVAIFVMDAEGGGLRRLTARVFYDCSSPRWSPDGKHLAFVSREPSLAPECSVFVVDRYGRAWHPLTDRCLPPIRWHRDGRISFSQFHDDEMYLCSIMPDGSDMIRLFSHGEMKIIREAWHGTVRDTPKYTRVRLSNDEQKLLLTKRGENALCIEHINERTVRRLTDDMPLIRDADWSPDGQRIAFTSYGDVADDLHIMDASGTNIQLVGEIAERGGFVWSPDSRHIAHIGFREHWYALYNFDIDRGESLHFADLHRDDNLFPILPDWSPDGRQIVYCTHDDDQHYIYCVGADGAHPRRLMAWGSGDERVLELAWGVD